MYRLLLPTLGAALIGMFGLTGCGMSSHAGEHFQMSGTPEGIRAFGDTLNGAMKTAKEGPDATNQYFNARSYYESEVTKRSATPGLWQKLISSESSEKAGS